MVTLVSVAPKGVLMPVSVDLSKQLDRKYEDLGLADVLAAPVSALAGVSDSDAEHLKAAFGITTIADLGKNKYFVAAAAMVGLAG